MAQAQISPTPPALLNTNAASDLGDDERPQLSTDGVGNWVTVWDSNENLGGTAGTDMDIFVSRSTDNGLTWSAPALVNSTGTTDTGDDLRPSMATDGSGNWVVVWSSNQNPGSPVGLDSDILFARSTDNGLTWSAAALLNTDGASDDNGDLIPRIATDGAGNWVAAWESSADIVGADFDIAVARSSNNGQTWTAPAILNSYAAVDDGIDARVEIVPAGGGVWMAVWSTNSNIGFVSGFDLDIAMARSTDNGATWSTAALLDPSATTDAGEDFRPALATDRAGNWVAMWHATGATGTDGDIFTNRSSDNGVTWTPAVLLNANGVADAGDDEFVRVTTDQAGNWVTVWESTENIFGTVGFDYEVFQSLSTNNGQTWTAPGLLNTDAATDAGNDLVPQVATNRLGTWVAVWESTQKAGTDLDITVARFTLAPAALAVTSIVPSNIGPTNANNINFQVTFNQEVINFNNAVDIILNHNGTSNASLVIVGGPQVYNVKVRGVSGPGWFTLAVSTTSDVRSRNGSPLVSSVTSPVVSIRRVTPRPRPINTTLHCLRHHGGHAHGHG